jgi:hypothetical protein
VSETPSAARSRFRQLALNQTISLIIIFGIPIELLYCTDRSFDFPHVTISSLKAEVDWKDMLTKTLEFDFSVDIGDEKIARLVQVDCSVNVLRHCTFGTVNGRNYNPVLCVSRITGESLSLHKEKIHA